jgi:hypothetical protein
MHACVRGGTHRKCGKKLLAKLVTIKGVFFIIPISMSPPLSGGICLYFASGYYYYQNFASHKKHVFIMEYETIWAQGSRNPNVTREWFPKIYCIIHSFECFHFPTTIKYMSIPKRRTQSWNKKKNCDLLNHFWNMT